MRRSDWNWPKNHSTEGSEVRSTLEPRTVEINPEISACGRFIKNRKNGVGEKRNRKHKNLRE